MTIVNQNGKPADRSDGRSQTGRRFFSDKAEALASAEALVKLKAVGGSVALTMPPALRQDALEAVEMHDRSGQSMHPLRQDCADLRQRALILEHGVVGACHSVDFHSTESIPTPAEIELFQLLR